MKSEYDIRAAKWSAVNVRNDKRSFVTLMRWAFKLPDKLSFNARSEGIERAKFWADSFQKRRCIRQVPFRSRKTCPMGRRVTNTSSIFPVEKYSEWPVYGSSGNIRRPVNGNRRSQF
jgi:hypothetical protein